MGIYLGTSFDGILILIDEADNTSKSLSLGSFLKLLSERLQRRGCGNVIFGLAGLPRLREALMESHPSSLRLFDEVPLGALLDDEVGRVVDLCITKANTLNPVHTVITSEARAALIYLSEGLPHFVQQFGYSAFATATNDIIEGNDVMMGAFQKGGALDLIGDRYYRDDFYNKVQSEAYRRVLRIMADHGKEWIAKDILRASFKGKESTLTNAIKALLDRKIIVSKEGAVGVYRLQHRGFAAWIKLYTADQAALKASVEGGGSGSAT